MTKDEALKLIVKEAVDGRNYYTWGNFTNEEEIIRVCLALKVLGFETELNMDNQIEVVQ